MFRGSLFDDIPYDLDSEYHYAIAAAMLELLMPNLILNPKPQKYYELPEEYKLSTLAEGKSFPLIHPVYLTSMGSAYRKQIYGRRYLHGSSPSRSWSSPNKTNVKL